MSIQFLQGKLQGDVVSLCGIAPNMGGNSTPYVSTKFALQPRSSLVISSVPP